jgi:large subunit ribosomal protein L2
MGKMLTHQRRGKGGVFEVPSHRFFAKLQYEPCVYTSDSKAQVIALHDDVGRSSPLAELQSLEGKRILCIAAEGLAIGDWVSLGSSGSPIIGSIMPLGNIPDGTPIFNIEIHPQDGGHVARAGGTSAFIVSHDEETGIVSVQLPSKRTLALSPKCMATIGIASGGGRLEKPFKKAGNAFFAAKARGRVYPKVRGTAMNAYDHPYGGRTGGRPTAVSRHAPPGRKAGHIAASSTGRRKAKRNIGGE